MLRRLILYLMLFFAVPVYAGISVKTVDFLKAAGLTVNAAGPLLVQMDSVRNRIILANTLTSSISIIDGKTHTVNNIPIKGRIFQHLKSEAMMINKRTGEIYLIGTKCFHIILPDKNISKTIKTKVQFESIAVDENTSNVFIAGRESKKLGLYDAKKKKLKMRKWLDSSEELINLNATPPPPIRKVISDNKLQRIIAVDGLTSTLFIFNSQNGKLIKYRQMDLTSGGRWHLAGYNEKTHCLYLVIEKADRKVIEAAKIDIISGNDVVAKLPEFTEGVGINYHPNRDEIYVPYDNYPTVHVVDFKNNGEVSEIKLPALGNDASAIDYKNDILYTAGWAHGEIDVIDLKTRKLIKRVPGLGIIPHTFNLAFNPFDNLLYIPKGATAVNGSFGAALSVFNPVTDELQKIYTGWLPVDLIELKERGSFLVFNNEDEFAEVKYDGSCEIHKLPFDYPIQAIHNTGGDVYLSYGAHQSYWPTVYIWDAKNGMFTIDKDDLSFYDRRIPRQAHKMTLDKNGVLYFTQNNWGGEEQFLGRLKDPVRVFNIGERLRLKDKVVREITQRILKYDSERNWLYLVRIGEQEQDPSILQIISLDSNKVALRLELDLTATDLVFDEQNIFVSNFESNTISIIDKNDFSKKEIKSGEKPLKLCRCGEDIYVINHLGNSISEVKPKGKTYNIPFKGYPDNLFCWNNNLILTSHSPEVLYVISFNPEYKEFSVIQRQDYPYGDTRFDSRNVSFYVNGQFGDAIFAITQAKIDQSGKLWLTDFLSGKLFILEKE